MGRTIVDEELKYTVIINGNKAQKELFDLEKAQRSLEATNRDLRAAKAKLISQGKKESEAYKRLSAELRENNKTLKLNKSRQAELRKELGVGALTMKQLRDEAKRLQLQLQNLTPGSAEFKRFDAELRTVNTRMKELRQGANQTQGVLQRFSGNFQSITSRGLGFIAMLTGAGYSVREFLGWSSELSDAQADVAKTTGLTNEEIAQLQGRLDLLDTRSSRIELLGLAEEAGRLGKRGVENIADFVAVADQIKVALGDDLQGNANENILLIGKLTEQYEVGKDAGLSFADGMTMVGSAINHVSASGSAQAGFMVDYMKRLVGISRQTGITADAQIGYAAVLDEAGQSVEVSGTTISKVLVDMAADMKSYAKVAGMHEDEFRRLFNEDANEALLKFLEGLNGNNAGLEEMAHKLDDLGVDGARASSVLAALASDTDKIREKQDLANESLHEATSLTEEFTNKNENWAAVLEKIGKETMNSLVDSKFSQWLQGSIIILGKLVGVVDDADGTTERWKERIVQVGRILVVATAALISHKAALQLIALWSERAAAATALQNMQTKISAYTSNMARNATVLYSAAKSLLTGNTKQATLAMKAFNTTTKANPIGLLLTILGAAIVAWQVYSDELSTAEKAQKAVADAQTAATKSISNELSELQLLLNTAKNENLTREQRIEAIERLQKLSPEYLGNLTLEKIGYIESKRAIDAYIRSLNAKALAQQLANKHAELTSQLEEERANTGREHLDFLDKSWAFIKAGGNLMRYEQNMISASIAARSQETASINEQISAIEERQQALMESGNADLGDFGGDPTPTNNNSRQRAEEVEAGLKSLRDKIQANYHEMDLMRMSANERELQRVRDKYAEMRKVTGIGEAELRDIAIQEEAEVNALRQQQEENHQQMILETRKKYQLLSREELLQLDIQELEKARDLELLSEEEFQQVKAAVIARYEEEDAQKRYEARKQYNLLTHEEDMATELEQLQAMYDQQLLTEEEFQQTKKQIEGRYTQMRRMAWLEDVRFYADMIGQMGSAVMSFRDAELAKVEEVTRKAGESEEDFTKRKEAEEAQRSEIMKKYAGIELLTKVAQITASTAVSVMKAMELGWPMGPILAGITLAQGIAQGAIAKAEYDKVQGYEGGYYPVMDQHGRRFSAGRENNAGTRMVNDPTILVGEKPELIVDPQTTKFLQVNYPGIIDTIYAAANRRLGAPSTTPTGSGSSTPSPSPAPAMPMQDAELTAAIKQLVNRLEKPITANVGDDQAKNLEELQSNYQEIVNSSRLTVRR